jgi:hypothetical protein
MKILHRLLGALALVAAAAAAQAATIDKMFTATFGHYSQQYQPGGTFMVFSQADRYQLDDGSTWDSGAGWHPDTQVMLKSIESDGAKVRYTFEAPEGGILFQNTDYDSGDHSAQGVLGAPKKLVLVAKIGSTKGKLSGYTKIISNDETWYGQPRFNFYSAAVGDRVYFRQDVVLLGASFTPELFNGAFQYNLTGVVDFTRKK